MIQWVFINLKINNTSACYAATGIRRDDDDNNT